MKLINGAIILFLFVFQVNCHEGNIGTTRRFLETKLKPLSKKDYSLLYADYNKKEVPQELFKRDKILYASEWAAGGTATVSGPPPFTLLSMTYSLAFTNIAGPSLSGTNLTGKSFEKASFTNLKIPSDTKFKKANLQGAVFKGCTFSPRKLTGIKSKTLNLKGADLQGTNFNEDNIFGGRLRINICGAKINGTTQFPKDFLKHILVLDCKINYITKEGVNFEMELGEWIENAKDKLKSKRKKEIKKNMDQATSDNSSVCEGDDALRSSSPMSNDDLDSISSQISYTNI